MRNVTYERPACNLFFKERRGNATFKLNQFLDFGVGGVVVLINLEIDPNRRYAR